MQVRFPSVVVLVALLAALAACGGESGSSTGNHMGAGHMESGGELDEARAVVPGAREIPIVGEDFSFAPDTISVAASEDVTLVLTSRDIEHDIKVEDFGHVVHAPGGSTERGGLRIDDPGTYDFWCSIPGHRAAGMQGTVTVTTQGRAGR